MTPPPGPLPRRLPERVAAFGGRLAVVDADGRATYADLDHAARHLSARLLDGRRDRLGERVVLLCRPGREFLTALLACWRVGAAAVPLHPDHPDAELLGLVADAEPSVIVASETYAGRAATLAGATAAVLRMDGEAAAPPADPAAWPEVPDDAPALMVFTSGTTGRPKGAVHTHASVRAQIEGMVEAWAWRPEDRILQVLPLHHVHGIVNVTLCPLWVGAAGEAPGRVDPVAVWERLASGEVTVFMAVPTIYARLVRAWDEADEATRRRWSDGAARLRLMVSGSAALPVTVLDEWERITSHVLLERYGMTEVGMALGNTLDRRVPGHVGVPFPGVRTRIVDDDGRDVPDGKPGELLLQGPQLFAGYWKRPDATAEAFTDGWFRTGDVVVRDPQGFRLLGRASVDILKTGGEKVSALEVEAAYREHPAVGDCAVVGLEDEEWGQRVAMAVVPAAGQEPDPAELRIWGKVRLAAAKVPTRYLVVDDLPRNAMGKVTKPAVVRLFEAPDR